MDWFQIAVILLVVGIIYIVATNSTANNRENLSVMLIPRRQPHKVPNPVSSIMVDTLSPTDRELREYQDTFWGVQDTFLQNSNGHVYTSDIVNQMNQSPDSQYIGQSIGDIYDSIAGAS